VLVSETIAAACLPTPGCSRGKENSRREPEFLPPLEELDWRVRWWNAGSEVASDLLRTTFFTETSFVALHVEE